MKKVTFRSVSEESNNSLKYIIPEYLDLKSHPQFNEKWVQERIEEHPEILDLEGDVTVVQKERTQSKGGRLDLLLKDQETGRRYTFELQLGVVDESHIIRAIEYWDNEKRRYPEIDHCCIICAETINARFLNVISLFNRQIPLIALQVKAIRIGENVTLTFTKVLDEIPRRLEADLEEEVQKTDRKSYEQKFSSEILVNIDQFALRVQKVINKEFRLSYTSPYIGCIIDDRAANFVVFKPHRSGALRIDLRLRLTNEQVEKLESAGIEVLDYAAYWRVHPIRLTKDQVINPPDEVLEIIKLSFENYFS
jgi:hypothetical protein